MNDFIGTWKLISYEYENAAGDKRYPFGTDAYGVIMYDASGYVSVQIYSDGRIPFESEDALKSTPDELKSAYEGLNSYYGPFTVNEAERIVTHHLEGSSLPNREGSNQIRYYEFAGDKLILKATPRQLNGEMLTGKLIWQRVTQAT